MNPAIVALIVASIYFIWCTYRAIKGENLAITFGRYPKRHRRFTVELEDWFSYQGARVALFLWGLLYLGLTIGLVILYNNFS